MSKPSILNNQSDKYQQLQYDKVYQMDTYLITNCKVIEDEKELKNKYISDISSNKTGLLVSNIGQIINIFRVDIVDSNDTRIIIVYQVIKSSCNECIGTFFYSRFEDTLETIEAMLNNAVSNYQHLQVDNCPNSLFNEVKTILEEKENHISILYPKTKKIKIGKIIGIIMIFVIFMSSLIYLLNFDLFSLIK
tara:strand:- start:106 stop:681 length:576 start_codon:yes stop_codon:yes gene_type:complete